MFEKFRKNAVLRFWGTYMAVILFAFLSCGAIMQRAFAVVRSNIVEENAYLLQQGVSGMDNMLLSIYQIGMQLSLSPCLQKLAQQGDTRDAVYYKVVNEVLQEYSQSTRFLDTFTISNLFISLDGMDRVIYDSAVYRSSVFQLHAEKWGVGLSEWKAFSADETTTPHFCVSESGELFYVFPCLRSMQDKVKFGSILFHVDRSAMLQYFDFVSTYSSYSIFLCQGQEVLIGSDALQCQGDLQPEWLTQSGEHTLASKLVISRQSPQKNGLGIILVLPEQEALTRLSVLQWQLIFLAALSLAATAVFAFFFSFRSGDSVNKIAQVLQPVSAYNTDLKSISNSVSQLVLAQQQDKPALINSFFHNLLKGNFLSQNELEYMAARAGLNLTGHSYRAAALRLFPSLAPEDVDGAVVETARALQNPIVEKLQCVYPAPLWAYKRNTLVHLFIIEEQDAAVLEEALRQIVQWLKKMYAVDAYWGIGTLCEDLLVFWRSSEEALVMADSGPSDTALRFYSETFLPDDAYSLPYTVEEHLVQGLHTGSRAELTSALDAIHTENFVRRALNKKQFLKLNRRITGILTDAACFDESDERLQKLRDLACEPSGECTAYFACLRGMCEALCDTVEAQRLEKRDRKMSAILSFIQENHANQDMGLALCSTNFNLSEGYLSMIFKAEMEENFADYLERIRINAACEKLKAGVLVTDVAEQTGYSSAQSFRRAFKRVMGVSPSEYRQ